MGRTTTTSGSDAKNPRGLWRRTTLEEYRKAKPAWEIVLDLDALGKAGEGELGLARGRRASSPGYERCLVSLSRGGADADVVREFDLETKAFVKDGYTLPEAKSRVAWRDVDSVFVGTDFGPGSLTKSGYPRIVKEWKRGTPLAEAAVVFEGRPEDMSVGAHRDLTPGFERDFVVRTADVLDLRDVPPPRRQAGQDREARRRRGRRSHREWLLLHAPHRLDGRRQDLSGRRAARDRLRGVPQGRPRRSTCCSSRPSGSRWPASARRGITSCSTSWTTSAAASTS